LIMADIEGYEVHLLDPAKVPSLRHADLLIEIHEDTEFTKQETAEKQMTDRLTVSHVVERRISRDRKEWIEEFRDLWHDKVSQEQIAKAVDEDRQRPTLWLWAKAKNS
jgi:hypothetical protein